MKYLIQESLRTELRFTGRDRLICSYQQDVSTLKRKKATRNNKFTDKSNIWIKIKTAFRGVVIDIEVYRFFFSIYTFHVCISSKVFPDAKM